MLLDTALSWGKSLSLQCKTLFQAIGRVHVTSTHVLVSQPPHGTPPTSAGHDSQRTRLRAFVSGATEGGYNPNKPLSSHLKL